MLPSKDLPSSLPWGFDHGAEVFVAVTLSDGPLIIGESGLGGLQDQAVGSASRLA